ncbi:uncharacterized protein METZ01_LOCUS440402 [marine metagenome]|uniref:Uncharacterized protein n=1 Tax=marine metagenome TaxID=408172 RepID=A0A382YYH0_9ZZZZ
MKPALIALLTCLCLGGCGEKSAVEQQAETTPSPTESAPKPKTKEPTEAEKKKFTETKAKANEEQPSTDKRASGNREKTQRRRRSKKTDEPSSTVAQLDSSVSSENELSADQTKPVKQSVSSQKNGSPAETQNENSATNLNSAGKWGQAGNDPRVAPQILAPGPVLVIAPQKPVTEYLPTIERDLGANHSSNWNRANNDPRTSRP